MLLLNLMSFVYWLCAQKRASGDPYLQHCVETAVHLANIGANATVVSAGLLHDTIDDSFMDYDHIFRMFGAGVADLVEGVGTFYSLYLDRYFKLELDNFFHSLLKFLAGYAASFSSYLDCVFNF